MTFMHVLHTTEFVAPGCSNGINFWRLTDTLYRIRLCYEIIPIYYHPVETCLNSQLGFPLKYILWIVINVDKSHKSPGLVWEYLTVILLSLLIYLHCST